MGDNSHLDASGSSGASRSSQPSQAAVRKATSLRVLRELQQGVAVAVVGWFGVAAAAVLLQRTAGSSGKLYLGEMLTSILLLSGVFFFAIRWLLVRLRPGLVFTIQLAINYIPGLFWGLSIDHQINGFVVTIMLIGARYIVTWTTPFMIIMAGACWLIPYWLGIFASHRPILMDDWLFALFMIIWFPLETRISGYHLRDWKELKATKKELAAAKQNIEIANARLEARVEERTAELRSALEAFSRFVPIEFLRTLGYDDITKARLGDAKERELAILFADVRNFTTLSEQMTPVQTFGFLNACLSRIGPHVRVHGGFVDKYIGDAIMALFPADPAQAVRAGIAMRQEVLAHNAAHPNHPPLAIGIGVHVGRVIMGTIGEEQRFEATVISDAVNLTARLETLTKQLDVSMLASQSVIAYLTEQEQQFTRWLGSFVVKGKSSAVELVEVFTTDGDALRHHKMHTRPRLRLAIEAYLRGELASAAEEFRQLAALHIEDGPARWWSNKVQRELSTGVKALQRDSIKLEEK